jgi:hypothetical protein
VAEVYGGSNIAITWEHSRNTDPLALLIYPNMEKSFLKNHIITTNYILLLLESTKPFCALTSRSFTRASNHCQDGWKGSDHCSNGEPGLKEVKWLYPSHTN